MEQKKYVVLAAGKLQELITEVNGFIELGYTPIGGIFVSPQTFNYMQTLIKI